MRRLVVAAMLSLASTAMADPPPEPTMAEPELEPAPGSAPPYEPFAPLPIGGTPVVAPRRAIEQPGGGSSLRVKIFAGPAARSLFGISMIGGLVGVEFGVDERARHIGWYGGPQIEVSTTPNGLLSVQPRIVLGVEGLWGRVRLGAGPNLSVLTLFGATGSFNYDLGVGVGAHLSVDVAQWNNERAAVFIGVRGSAEIFLFSLLWQSGPSAPAMAMATAFVGVRL